MKKGIPSDHLWRAIFQRRSEFESMVPGTIQRALRKVGFPSRLIRAFLEARQEKRPHKIPGRRHRLPPS